MPQWISKTNIKSLISSKAMLWLWHPILHLIATKWQWGKVENPPTTCSLNCLYLTRNRARPRRLLPHPLTTRTASKNVSWVKLFKYHYNAGSRSRQGHTPFRIQLPLKIHTHKENCILNMNLKKVKLTWNAIQRNLNLNIYTRHYLLTFNIWGISKNIK